MWEQDPLINFTKMGELAYKQGFLEMYGFDERQTNP